MIGEFAFTPSVFDESAHFDTEAWRDQLRELGNAMFPKTAVSAVMVANLYDASWYNVALTTVTAIKDSKARVLCENIFKGITSALVPRPPVGEWPMDDTSWCREAIAAHGVEPIDRIVSCRAVQDMLAAEGHPVRCLSEVHGEGFWREITSQWEQPLTITSQIQAIRKLTVHAEFLCLITPYIGAGDDETAFAQEMIRAAHGRPAGFSSVDVEIHTEGPANPESTDFPKRLNNVVENITIALRSALGANQAVQLNLWPKLLDRYLIAGIYTTTSGGARVRSPRWGIAMQHVARRADERQAKPPTTWSLLPSIQLNDMFRLYCTGKPVKAMHSSNITKPA